MKISLLQALIGEISFQITTDNLIIRAGQIRAFVSGYGIQPGIAGAPVRVAVLGTCEPCEFIALA